RRDDPVRGREVSVVEALAVLPDEGSHLGEEPAKLLLVAALECRSGLAVEPVEGLDGIALDPVLTLAHEPDDHCFVSFDSAGASAASASASGSPPASSFGCSP